MGGLRDLGWIMFKSREDTIGWMPLLRLIRQLIELLAQNPEILMIFKKLEIQIFRQMA